LIYDNLYQIDKIKSPIKKMKNRGGIGGLFLDVFFVLINLVFFTEAIFLISED